MAKFQGEKNTARVLVGGRWGSDVERVRREGPRARVETGRVELGRRGGFSRFLSRGLDEDMKEESVLGWSRQWVALSRPALILLTPSTRRVEDFEPNSEGRVGRCGATKV